MDTPETEGLISKQPDDDHDDAEKTNTATEFMKKVERSNSLSNEIIELLGAKTSLCISLENFEEHIAKKQKDSEIILARRNLSRSSGCISQLKASSSQQPSDTSPEFLGLVEFVRYLPCDDDVSSSDDGSSSSNVHLQQHVHGHIVARRRQSISLPNEQKIFYNDRPFLVRYETSQSSESIICRICHSCGDEKLITPCGCAGSSQYVHATCLVTWFKKSVKRQCELCKSDVKIRKINHHIASWRKPEDRPVPLIWFSVFFIGLFLNIVSIYVNASEYCKSTACLIFYVVNGFGIILDAAFLWFWFLKCRHYWKKWCALNQDWFIDDRLPDKDIQVQYVQGCPV